MLVVHTCRDG